MKIIFWEILFFFTISISSGQDRIWGVSSGGMGAGLIYSVNTDGTNFRIAKNFEIQAARPVNFIDGGDEFLYGIAKIGGGTSNGRIIRVKKDRSGYTILHDFLNGETGIKRLTKFGNLLIGTVSNGGLNNLGYIFTISTDGSNFNIIFNFTDDGSLVRYPYFLLKASDGFFYGLAGGGSANNGTIFRFDITNNSILKIYDVNTWGGVGFNDIIEGSDGYLYGTTSRGYAEVSGGSIYKISKTGSNFKVLRAFSSDLGGKTLLSALIQSPSGELIGTYNYGGPLGRGGIFSIEQSGMNFKILCSFSKEGGQSPTGNLLQDNKYIYGVTAQDGFNLFGSSTIFRMKHDGTEYQTIANTKSGGQMISSSDKLYYSIEYGGGGSYGEIDAITLSTNSSLVITDFNPLSGADPNGKLFQHSNGFLYGSTLSGGQFGEGIIYKINPSNDNFETLFHFSKQQTIYSIIERDNGKLVGISYNSNESKSDILEFDTKSNNLVVRYSLPNKILRDINQVNTGEFIGTASLPNQDNVQIIRIDSSFKEAKIKSTDLVIRQPLALIQDDTISRLYGTTYQTSSFDLGKIFIYDYYQNKIDAVYRFNNSDIRYLFEGTNGKLVSASNKNVIGLTGSCIFSIKTDGSNYNRVYNFPSYIPPIDGLVKVSEKLFFGVLFNYNGNNSKGSIFSYHEDFGYSTVKDFDTSIITYIQYGLSLSKVKYASLMIYGNLYFENTEVNKTTSKKIKLKNFGNDELSISEIILPEGFSTTMPQFKLAPGEIKDITVSFSPLFQKKYEGTMSIVSNSLSEFNKLQILGNGIVITGVERSSTFSVFPNPAHTVVTIDSKEIIESMELYNMMGEPTSFTVTLNQETSKSINISSLSAGIYYLIVRTESNIESKKIIKL